MKLRINISSFRIGADSGLKPCELSQRLVLGSIINKSKGVKSHNTMIPSSGTSNFKNSSVGYKRRGLSEMRDGRKEKRRKIDRSVTQQHTTSSWVVRTAKDCGTKLHSDPQLSKRKIESKGDKSSLNEDGMSSCHQVSTTVTAAISAKGWNPSSDSKLSPQKALRATLLKTRFADTILRAKQKSLQIYLDKDDHMSFQLKKEISNKQHQEERARREIRASKEAVRTRAEAERKLRRERERKAARLALQQMVKTVEINNDHRILKDLELLSGCSQSDQYSYNSGESSPEVGSGERGHFSRPLEKLGLFMKDDYNDYMEDEDDDRATLTELVDIEEGEIVL